MIPALRLFWSLAASFGLLAWLYSAAGQQSWYRQHPSILRRVFPRRFHRLGALDDLPLRIANPDTTAVVLNWSRLPNVLRISSLLCSPALEGVISEVFIWNNNPNPITFRDFAGTGCPESRLRIHNSPENMYFQARFMACSQARSPLCFIQDDDYLVTAEVIHTLHARMQEAPFPHTIHLLPPQEHLSTSLDEIFVDGAAPVHTSFAWLGHGAMLHRSRAVDFLALLHALNASDAELKMADNYYTILSNRVPEVWLDQGVELGGGQPFTVGVEGSERNNRHLLRATEFLHSIVSEKLGPSAQLPYVSRAHAAGDETLVARAVCRKARCLLETNIRLLPADLEHTTDDPRNMLRLAAQNHDRLSNATTELYLEHALSFAVDDRPETYFHGLANASADDFVILDYLVDNLASGWSSLRMVWIVDTNTQRALEASELAFSADGLTWHPILDHSFACEQAGETASGPLECAFEWSWRKVVGSAPTRARSLRLKLNESQDFSWVVHEISVEGRR